MILSIEFQTKDELIQKISKVLVELAAETPAQPVAVEVPAQTEMTLPPKKRGPKSKSEEKRVAVMQEAALEKDIAPVVEAPKVATPKDKVIEAVTSLSNKKGVPAAIQVLGQFNARRVGELPEASYEDFIKACNTALA